MKTTTDFLTSGKVTLIALRDGNDQASGDLMVDDGISYDSMVNFGYDYHKFQM
jgi:hypothetical protein